jgi:hypothetical protein
MVRVETVNNGQMRGMESFSAPLSALDFKINSKVIACGLLLAAAVAASVTLAVMVSPIALTGLSVAAIALFAAIYFSMNPSTTQHIPGHQIGFENPTRDNCSLNAAMNLLKNPRLERVARTNCPEIANVTQARFQAESKQQSAISGHAVEQLRRHLTVATRGDIQSRGHIDAADSLNHFFQGSIQLRRTINGRETTSDKASMISLPMDGRETTFHKKLCRFFKSFTVDYWDDQRRCHGGIIELSMTDAPMDLLIQMQRFTHVYENGRVVGRKLSQDFSMPATMALPRGAVDSAEKTPPEYECQGFIVHEGGLNGGHYYTYRKEGAQWFLCNDAHVKPVSTQQALAQMKQGYIYHYAKIY